MLRPILALHLAVLALGLSACASRPVKQMIVDDGTLRILLRGEEKGGEIVDRGYDHPITISATRIANILSAIDVRLAKDNERVPAIPIELLYGIAQGVADALGKANSGQEVVVVATRTTRRLGIFTNKFVTSFVAYVSEEQLFVHLGYVDWEVPRGPDERILDPKVGREYMAFRVLPVEGYVAVGDQSIAAYWRNPIFQKSRVLGRTQGGGLTRRTILLEAPEEDIDIADEPEIHFDRLAPATLRRLADLEEMRNAGEVTEAEYASRRREILQADPNH